MRFTHASIVALLSLTSVSAFAAPSILCKVQFEEAGEILERSAAANSDGCALILIDDESISKTKFWGGFCGKDVALSLTNTDDLEAVARGENKASLEIKGLGKAICEIQN